MSDDDFIVAGCVAISADMAELPSIITVDEIVASKYQTTGPNVRVPPGVPSPPEHYKGSGNLRPGFDYEPLEIYYKGRIRLRIRRNTSAQNPGGTCDVSLADLVAASPIAKGYFEQIFQVDNFDLVLKNQRNCLITLGKLSGRSELAKLAKEFPHIGRF